MPKQPLLHRFVRNKQDLVGLTAYALYQQAKAAYIESVEQREGRPPSEAEMLAFREGQTTSCMIEIYLNEADSLISDTLGEVFVRELNDSKQELEKNYIELLQQAVKPIKTPWWENVLYGILSAFVFALIVAAFAFIKQQGDEQPAQQTQKIEQHKTEQSIMP